MELGARHLPPGDGGRAGIEQHPQATYTVTAQDLLSLVSLVTGPRDAQQEHLERVRRRFPALVGDGEIEADGHA